MIPDSELLEDADMLPTPIRPTPLAPATNGLQLLRFADEEIQVIHDADGEMLFRSGHVCRAIGLENPRDAIRRISPEFKGVVSTDTLGGAQRIVYLKEPGVWELLASARVRKNNPNSDRIRAFRHWLFAEVLPSIRKHGRYDAAVAAPAPAPEVRLAALADEVEATVKVARSLGLEGNQAILAASIRIKRAFGVDLQKEFQLQLPSPVNQPYFTATQVGQDCGLSGQKVNARLAELGFQVRDKAGRWALTDAGRSAGGRFFDVTKVNAEGTVQQIKWLGSVATFLKTPAVAAA